MKTKIKCRHCGELNTIDLGKYLAAMVDMEVKKEREKLDGKAESLAKKKSSELLDDMAKEMNALRRETRLVIKSNREQLNKMELENIQLRQQLDSLKDKTKEMLQKHSVTSQKLQGDSLETAMMKYLETSFPGDLITETKNGAKGADCIQVVRNSSGVASGKIMYECKFTKSFSGKWIPKLKADLREENATIGIIVTESLPKEMERFGMINGVLVCTFDDVKALVPFLREQILAISESVSPLVDMETKAQKIYAYLTSPSFKQKFEAIIDSYRNLQTQLNKEKEYFSRNWKEREKAIECLTFNANHIYGEIKGIAGKGALELDAPEIGE